MLALVATVIVVNVARTLLGLPAEASDQFGTLDDTTATRVMIGVAAVIGAPLFEELLFRGVVLHALLGWGEVVAIVGSSTLFGLTHVNPELGLDQNVLLLVSTTTTGCVLAWMARRAGPPRTEHGRPTRPSTSSPSRSSSPADRWRPSPPPFRQAGRRWTTSPTANVRRVALERLDHEVAVVGDVDGGALDVVCAELDADPAAEGGRAGAPLVEQRRPGRRRTARA